jgi:ketol-acid reductoisomerase
MVRTIKERLSDIEDKVYTEEWIENLESRAERLEQKKQERLNKDVENPLKNLIVLIPILCAIGSAMCTILIFLSRLR